MWGELWLAEEGARASRGTARSSRWPGQRHTAVRKAGSRRSAGEAHTHPRLRYEARCDVCPSSRTQHPPAHDVLHAPYHVRTTTDEVAGQLFLPPFPCGWPTINKERQMKNKKLAGCRFSRSLHLFAPLNLSVVPKRGKMRWEGVWGSLRGHQRERSGSPRALRGTPWARALEGGERAPGFRR